MSTKSLDSRSRFLEDPAGPKIGFFSTTKAFISPPILRKCLSFYSLSSGSIGGEIEPVFQTKRQHKQHNRSSSAAFSTLFAFLRVVCVVVRFVEGGFL